MDGVAVHPSAKGGRTPARLRDFVGWSLAAVLLVGYVTMLRRYSVNFPWADDFTQILNVPFNVAQRPSFLDKLDEIFSLSIEHRIATLRLAALAQAHLLGGLDFRGLIYAGSALLVLAGVLMIATVDRDVRPLFAAIAAALLLSPANYEATFWATGALQHFGVLGYAFAALYCLSRAGVGRQLGAGGLALAAACTSSGALMVFPSAVLLLALMRRWRAALAWTIGGAALFGVYFIGYQAPPYQGSLATYLRDPIVPMRFFFMALGSVGVLPAVALGLGVILGAVWAWLLITKRIRSLPPVLVAWAAFLLLTFAAITWGRAGFGDRGALLSRYRAYAELMVLISIAAVLWQLPRVAGMRLLWVALPLSIAWFFAAWRQNLGDVERFFMSHRTDLDYYVAEGHGVPDEFPALHHREFLLMAAKKINAYDPGRFANEPRQLVAESRTLDATHLPPLGIEPPIAGKRAVIVTALDVSGQARDAAIWLESGDRRYRGRLGAPPSAPLALGKRTGFLWGVYSFAGVAPGSYRVGVGIDDATAPTVNWSSFSVDVE